MAVPKKRDKWVHGDIKQWRFTCFSRARISSQVNTINKRELRNNLYFWISCDFWWVNLQGPRVMYVFSNEPESVILQAGYNSSFSPACCPLLFWAAKDKINHYLVTHFHPGFPLTDTAPLARIPHQFIHTSSLLSWFVCYSWQLFIKKFHKRLFL